MVRALMIAVLGIALHAHTALAQTYLLKPGDTVRVSVLEDPALNQTLLIRPDGRISMPLAGTLEAAGRSPEALQQAIRQRLSQDFVSPPTVTVAVTGVAQGPALEEEALEAGALASIYVLGQVRGPGVYEVETPIDLLQLLAIVGGVDTFAARDRIQVRRRGPEGESIILFNYDVVEDGLAPARNVALQDGDIVVVPEGGLFD